MISTDHTAAGPQHPWRLPPGVGHVIAAAKRAAKGRRSLAVLTGALLMGLVAALTFALGSPSGPLPGGPLTGPLATQRYLDGFSLRYPKAWTPESWCWTGASITSPIGILTNARPAPNCTQPYGPGPPVTFPPREHLGPNTVSIYLASGGLFPGEKLHWNTRIGGKLAYIASPVSARAGVSGLVTCPAGVAAEYRIVHIAAVLGVVGATICGPDLADGNAAVDRILASIRFTR